MKAIWVKNLATAAQYAHLIGQELKNAIKLEEFGKLPQLVRKIFTDGE